MKEAFELIRKKDVLDIIHSHSCNTARIEEGVLNLPVISVFARNDKIKERINDVIQRISCGAEKFDYDRGSVDAYRNTLSIVSEVEAEYGNGWIPVEKELPPAPEENPLFDGKPVEMYLISLKGTKYPWRAFWTGKNFTDGWSIVHPEAWMPLPEPYKPVRGELNAQEK